MSLCAVPWAEDKTDLNIVHDRILQPLLNKDVDTATVLRLLKTNTPDGKWDDIDYQDKTPGPWKTDQHLANLSVLATAYTSAKSPFKNDPELKRAVFAGLDYWLEHDFQNPNWWHNDIGVPQQLGPVLLLLDAELSEDQRAKGLEILQRAKLGMTGQNLVWLAEVSLIRAVLEHDPDLAGAAFKRIADEISTEGQEGIQADFSFHQHGACLYNHGYGAGFALDCSRLAALAGQTPFAFSPEKIGLLTSYLLDGSQWMAYGSTEDYGADGREIVRPGQTAKYLAEAANDLLHLPTGRENEIKALVQRTADRSVAPLEGNRHFWCSDFMVHHRKNYYASVRGFSTRTDNTDNSHNGEGLKSHHIADGCNFLFVTGCEYDDIFPVWDWQKIPGATVEQTGVFVGSPRRKGTRDFVGGVSDGRYGLAVLDFERDTLHARKAWFFFDTEYVCLGAGIVCESQYQVLTTVNQCYESGDVTAFSAGKKQRLSPGEHRLTAPVTVYHANVAYLFQSDAHIMLRNDSQAGSWHEISDSLSSTPISREVFTLCIDHGEAPRCAAYSYIVCPSVNEQQAEKSAEETEVVVLSNSTDRQAVEHRKLRLTQMAFFKPGGLGIDENLNIAVDNPCLLMVQHLDNGI
ncbi:MAG: polysaccharide lyase beta-sandwich domain-containing protein, partial [Candidatus Hydrogenedentes bacterium]|nr:polysaccharide lyase beta-sandwich domain-containing protein [Candidatus Hydrogenedentota bacterium]